MNCNGLKWWIKNLLCQSKPVFKAGEREEQLACQYLQQQGLAFVAKNWHSRFGEIDLIMRDQHTLVFVEVKARKPDALVSGGESITRQKQQKLIKTASVYLQTLDDTPYCRFDVVIMVGPPWQYTWLPSAFEA